MKKLTGILIAAALILAPMSVSALEMMTDSNMKDVTGQAGVSIAIDDVVLYQESLADTTYWDTDGTDKWAPSAALVTAYPDHYDYSGEYSGDEYGVTISYDGNVQKLITIDAITGRNGLAADYYESELGNSFDDLTGAALTGIGFDITGASALTIDVGVAETLTDGKQWNSNNLMGGEAADAQIAGVVIGLPTVEIVQYHNNDRRSISISANDLDGDGAVAVNTGRSFIDIEQSGTSKMAILDGVVEIAPH